MSDIFINTLVFNDVSTRHDQKEYILSLYESGYKNIEIRREYLNNLEDELEDIGEVVREKDITLYFSIPDTLFDSNKINQEKITNYFQEAEILGSKTVKLVVGDYNEISTEDEAFLKKIVSKEILLFIENDQTQENGKVDKILKFLKEAKEKNINVRLTFDIGNWFWTQEDPKKNAEILNEFIDYVHFKDVTKVNGLNEAQLLNTGYVDIKYFIDYFSGKSFGIEYPCGKEVIPVIKEEINKLS